MDNEDTDDNVAETLVRESLVDSTVGGFCGFGHWLHEPASLMRYRFHVDGVTVSDVACYGHTEAEWNDFIAQNVAAIRGRGA